MASEVVRHVLLDLDDLCRSLGCQLGPYASGACIRAVDGTLMISKYVPHVLGAYVPKHPVTTLFVRSAMEFQMAAGGRDSCLLFLFYARALLSVCVSPSHLHISEDSHDDEAIVVGQWLEVMQQNAEYRPCNRMLIRGMVANAVMGLYDETVEGVFVRLMDDLFSLCLSSSSSSAASSSASLRDQDDEEVSLDLFAELLPLGLFSLEGASFAESCILTNCVVFPCEDRVLVRESLERRWFVIVRDPLDYLSEASLAEVDPSVHDDPRLVQAMVSHIETRVRSYACDDGRRLPGLLIFTHPLSKRVKSACLSIGVTAVSAGNSAMMRDLPRDTMLPFAELQFVPAHEFQGEQVILRMPPPSHSDASTWVTRPSIIVRAPHVFLCDEYTRVIQSLVAQFRMLVDGGGVKDEDPFVVVGCGKLEARIWATLPNGAAKAAMFSVVRAYLYNMGHADRPLQALAHADTLQYVDVFRFASHASMPEKRCLFESLYMKQQLLGCVLEVVQRVKRIHSCVLVPRVKPVSVVASSDDISSSDNDNDD
jgi:hypothetical protein